MAGATAQEAQTIMELERRCRTDFEYCCANMLWIRPKDEALCRLNLLWPQRYVYRRFLKPAWERKEALGLVVLKTRRVFMTTLFMAILYHRIRWYKGINAYVLANDDPTLADVYGMAQRMHSNLPPDFVPPVERNNTEVLAYAPPWDCSLRARVAKHEQIGRGTTLQAVLWDEAAFSPAPEVTLLGFLDAVPRTSASLLAINSTANGEGTWWHAIWNEMNKTGGTELGGRKWQTVFLAAWQNPHNRLAGVEVHDLDDEETYLVETFHVDDPYLAWRRAGINEYERLFPGAGMRQWRQENPNCISSESLIGTEQGLLPIKDLASAQRTATGTIGEWRKTGTALVWQVTTRLGYQVEATEDHQIKTLQCWRKVRQLKPGHTVCLAPPRFAEHEYVAHWRQGPAESSLHVTEALGLWLGYFMGDGSFSWGTVSIGCTAADTDVVTEVLTLFRDVWGIEAHPRVIGKRRGGIEIRVYRKRLEAVLSALGIIRERPEVSRKRASWIRHVCVPDVIWRSPRPVVRAFLQGLFEADGSNVFGSPKIVFWSKYRQFLRDIQLLLLGFGITSRLGKPVTKRMDGKEYTGQDLVLRAEETDAFNREIGFRSARKRERTASQVRRDPSGGIRQPIRMQDTIASIRPTRFADVYDLGIVEPHHAFDANGLLVHNSPSEAFQSALDCIFPEDAMAALREQWRPPAESYRLYQTGIWKQTMLRVKDTERAWQAYVLQSLYDRDEDTGGPAARCYVWEPPKRGYQYAIGVDVGLGVGGDDSAIVVMRYPGWVTVAHYADNVTAPKQFAYVVGAIADWYGRESETLPIVTVELKNAGILINTELDTMMGGYQLRTYVWEYWDKIGSSQLSTKTGWLTTEQTKFLMVGAANSLLMAEMIRLPSEAVWHDMKTTYEVKRGIYRTKGADLAMAWLLAVVTCYRKYARFQWGEWLDPAKKSSVYPDMPGRPDADFDDQEEPWTELEKVYHDTGWLKMQAERSDRATGISFGSIDEELNTVRRR